MLAAPRFYLPAALLFSAVVHVACFVTTPSTSLFLAGSSVGRLGWVGDLCCVCWLVLR